MKEGYTLKSIDELKTGDHLCCIYSTEAEHRDIVTTFLAEGLGNNQKVLYILDAHRAGAIEEYLRSAGIDAAPYLESGQLTLLSADESYTRKGVFDPDGMIEMLGSETQSATAEGYSALRVTGEMSWALRGIPGSERLMEYEAKLNRFFPGSRCLALCQYDRRSFEPHILQQVLVTHPLAVVGTEVLDNYYYMPPDVYLADDSASEVLDLMIENLEQKKKVEAGLRKALNQSILRRAEAAALLEAARAVLEHQDFEPAAKVIFDSCKGLIGARSGYVALLSEDGSENEVLFLDSGGLPCTVDQQLPMPIRGLRAEAYRTGTTVYDNDFANSEWMKYMPEGHVRLDNVMFAPLVLEGKTVGLIGLANKPGGFDDGDTRTVSGMAEIASVALLNARYLEELSDSVQRFREISENSPIGIEVYDAEGRLQHANPSCLETFGVNGIDDVSGFKLLDDPNVTPQAKEKLKRGEPVRYETEFDFEKVKEFDLYPTTRSGSIWLDVIITPLVREGSPRGYLVQLLEITEKKKIQEALEESEEKYRELAETLPQALFELDPRGIVTYVNKAGYEMLGYTPADIGKGVHALEIIAEEDRERVAGAIAKMATGDSRGAKREYLAKRRDGSTFPSVVYSTLITDEAGEYAGIRGLLTDISERKRYEDELASINAELESYAHVVSHDLKGPLSGVSIACDTIGSLIRELDDPPDDMEEIIELGKKSLERSIDLIDSLLALAEAGQEPTDVVQVDVEETVREVLNERASNIKAGGITVRVDEDLGRVRANATHVYQVFSNLIGNAIRHCDSPDPVLEIRLLANVGDRGHRYLVKDNGSGIPPELEDSLFMPFTKGRSGDTGVGLATVKKIIGLYEGSIRAYNDGGACFDFTLFDADQ